MGDAWITVWVAGITAAAALAGSALALIPHFLEARRTKKSVRAAIFAEIGALAHLIREQMYIEELERDLRDLQLRMSCATPFTAGEVAPLTYEVPVPENHNLIYRTHIGQLGVLEPSEAELVVLFYQFIQSATVDASPNGYLGQGTYDTEKVISTLRMLRKVLEIEKMLNNRWTQSGH